MLASGSQDNTIRLWNIEPLKAKETPSKKDLVDELLDNFEASLGDLGENEEGGRQISLKHHILTVKTGPDRFVSIFTFLSSYLILSLLALSNFRSRSMHCWLATNL